MADYTKMLAPELQTIVLNFVDQRDVMRMAHTNQSSRAIASPRPDYYHDVHLDLPKTTGLDVTRYSAIRATLQEIAHQVESVSISIHLAAPKGPAIESLRAAAHDTVWSELCALLGRTLSVVKRLTLAVHSPFLMDRLLKTALCAGPVPRLESITITSAPVKSWSKPILPVDLFQGHAPRLLEVILLDHGITLLPKVPPHLTPPIFQSVQALTVIDRHVFKLIVDKLMPNLRTVTIHALWWHNAIISLPLTLKELRIGTAKVAADDAFNQYTFKALQTILARPTPLQILEVPYGCHPMFHADMFDPKPFIGAPNPWSSTLPVASQPFSMSISSVDISDGETEVRITLTSVPAGATVGDDERRTRIFCTVIGSERKQAQVLTPFEFLVGQLVQVELAADFFTPFICMSDGDLFPALEQLTIDVTETDNRAYAGDRSDSDESWVIDSPPASDKTENKISRAPSLMELIIVHKASDVPQKERKIVSSRTVRSFGRDLRLDRRESKPRLRFIWVKLPEGVETVALNQYFVSVTLA